MHNFGKKADGGLPGERTYDPHLALAAAVVLAAIVDARKGDQSARAWLRYEGWLWAEISTGWRVDEADFMDWIDAGCPPGGLYGG